MSRVTGKLNRLTLVLVKSIEKFVFAETVYKSLYIKQVQKHELI